MRKIILGIETSCDDTGLGLYQLGVGLLAHHKLSSANLQAQYGGVVPEVAARYHADQILGLLVQMLQTQKVLIDEIVAIAYTATPGLVGCLMVGKQFAQTLGWIWSKPLIPVNHLYAHIFSVGLDQTWSFPFIALVASGKTTSLYLVQGLEQIQLLNATVDDAIGEAYDKVGRVMGLAYPAGPAIDQLFDPTIPPIVLAQQPNVVKPFSYSGIKTAAIHAWNRLDPKLDLLTRQKILATSFQTWIVRSVVRKIQYYMQLHAIDHLVVAGGVAANQHLRATLQKTPHKIQLVKMEFATDNGAMIAYYGALIYQYHQSIK